MSTRGCRGVDKFQDMKANFDRTPVARFKDHICRSPGRRFGPTGPATIRPQRDQTLLDGEDGRSKGQDFDKTPVI
jgi:hypothetical protein